jgi:hypothetical protein
VGDGIAAADTLSGLAARSGLFVSRPMREALHAVAPSRAAALTSLGTLTDAALRTHELFALDRRAAHSARRRIMVGAVAAGVAVLGMGIMVRVLRPATIEFDITPRGDIFVNGELKGTTPPLTRIQVASGLHTIEVRNEPYAPLRLEMRLKPAEEMKVVHAFGGRRSARKEGDSLVEELWRRLQR